MTDVKNPCPGCPFARAIPPGALGGATPEVYVGQAIGPFRLPCHAHYDSSKPDWKQTACTTPQCAGAAIFRANMGVSDVLPAQLHKLPADYELVFASPLEFYVHHKRITHREAAVQLMSKPPLQLLRAELAKQEVRVLNGK